MFKGLGSINSQCHIENGEIQSKYETTPTVQEKYTEQYSSVCLEWKEIYYLPLEVLNDTKLREFQYKILIDT